MVHMKQKNVTNIHDLVQVFKYIIKLKDMQSHMSFSGSELCKIICNKV